MDRLGPKRSPNAWSFVRQELRLMLEAGRHGNYEICSVRYQATKVTGITPAAIVY
jgi:hypothetical protein